MDTVDCPVCGAAVAMQARQTGGYGSKPVWVFQEHPAAESGAPCAASLKSAAEAAEAEN